MFFINLDYESKERFDLSRFVEFTNGCHDFLLSYFVRELKNLKQYSTFVVQNEEYRPELISYKIYGSVQYWWIIMFYNDLVSIEDITTGLMIGYPSIADLESLYFTLKSKSLEQERLSE